MNANIFFMELRRHRRGILIWCAVLVGLNTFMMFFYPVVIGSGVFEQLDSFFKNPFFKGMLTTFGVNMENMTSVLGYYVTYNAVYTMLLGSIVAILLGAGLVAREETEKTAEFLLTKPVTRGEVLNSKMAALGCS
ncbi:MAG: ABC transporter permease subunit [bacterium]|nr:ABC transporter permease subunit [bacterium]